MHLLSLIDSSVKINQLLDFYIVKFWSEASEMVSRAIHYPFKSWSLASNLMHILNTSEHVKKGRT